jgi:riboflavin kinase/FMN adenylyltransferase
MRFFRHTNHLPDDARGAVVALGNFDGVHRGHQAVIRHTRELAERAGRPSAVLTFEPHPRSLFRPDDPPFRLTPLRSKAHALSGLGVDLLFVIAFDQAFSRRTAAEFIEDVLVRDLAVSQLVAGADFVFGQGRAGNMDVLAEAGARHGFAVEPVTAVAEASGNTVSSTRIRALLQEGDPRGAADLLGRPWEIDGRVQHGDKRGRILGFPTANLELGEYVRPAYGIYAIRAALDAPDPVWLNGVASLGTRPMWRTDEPLLEANLFDFQGDLYGRHLRVQLVERLRGEAAFEDVDALVRQMNLDKAQARTVLGG